jgi:uncharacterized protein (TIGR02271 family)
MSEVVRHEEELHVEGATERVGAIHARKRNDVEAVTQIVERDVEDADVERVPATEGDSGEIETLPDGSVSIPLFEEELVVTKRLVVRERVIIRKRTTAVEHRVEAQLRRERVEIMTDGEVELEDAG